MAERHQLSDLQIAILQVLWAQGEATVTEVQEGLRPDRDLAPTTVGTLLTRLESRGIVAHRPDGRQFLYRAAVAERDVRRSMVAALTERLFEGDPAALVHHLIDEGEIDAEELARLRELVAARTRKSKGRHSG